MSDVLTIERDGGVAVLTLNRPAAYNALDVPLVEALRDGAAEVGRDERVRAVVITGAGKAFCAGGDLKTLRAAGANASADVYRLAGIFHEGILELRRMPKPVLAAVNGPCAGGGFSLACACDLRIASDASFFQLAYTAGGLSIDGGGTWTLPRLVGLSRALHIGLVDPRISPEDARDIGLVTEVVPADHLMARAGEIAGAFTQASRDSVANAKRLIYASAARELEAQLETERAALAEVLATDNGQEALAAFAEKRKPKFR